MSSKTIARSIPPVAEDPAISKETKVFLAALNVSGGSGLETLSPKEARKVLVNAQQSVTVDYS